MTATALHPAASLIDDALPAFAVVINESIIVDGTEPGYGRIACDLRVQPCGPDRTLLTYECRTATSSADAHLGFANSWRLIRPFVGHIMQAPHRDHSTRRGRGDSHES